MKAALKRSPYGAVQNVDCHYENGSIILEGEVLTFFQKQQAQATVAKIPGASSIVDRIRVRKN